MGSSDYATIRLPRSLVDPVDDLVRSGLLGFRTRAEFVADAIRRRLETLLPLLGKDGE